MADNIPPWGCPWHGLITDGQLALPNGTSIPMRQPQGVYANEFGITNLIDLSAPAVETTFSDLQKGKQWLNKSILSAGQIHGKDIGGGSWVYQAPDLSLWLVSTSMHGVTNTGSTVDVTLSRFGEFGAAAESHSYSVTPPSIQHIRDMYYNFDAHYIDNERIYLHATHPSGKAAVFELSCEFRHVNDVAGYYRYNHARGTAAWYEIKLSGNAAECVITIDLIYEDRAYPLIGSGTGNFPDFVWSVVGNTAVTDTTNFTADECGGSFSRVTKYSAVIESGGSGSGSYALNDSVLAVFYNADGSRSDISMTITAASSISRGASVASHDDIETYDVAMNELGGCYKTNHFTQVGEYVSTVTTSQNESLTIKYKVSGTVVATDVTTINSSSSISTDSNGVGKGRSHSLAIRDNGVEIERLNSYDAEFFSKSFGINWFSLFYRTLWLIGGTNEQRLRKRTIRSSNNVISLARDFLTNETAPNGYPVFVTAYGYVVTPAGKVVTDELNGMIVNKSDSGPALFGSYSPITGQAARTLNTPVCWT